MLEGTLSVYLDGRWRTLRAGESIEIPRGHVHTLRNRGDQQVRVLDVHMPALRFEEYIASMQRLVATGRVTSLRSPRSLIHLAMLLCDHRDNQISASGAGRLGESLLAWIGKRILGYRVG